MSVIDVWLVPVEVGAAGDAAKVAMLGTEERSRIASLGFAADRDRAVTARVAARHAVGRRLGLTPDRVPLTGGGIPAVQGVTINVSWSHSGAWVALAISDERPVGIDIEEVLALLPTRALAGIGVASLEEFVALEAASKATACRYGGRWPPGVHARRLCAPTGYLAAVAAAGDDWTAELHMKPPVASEPGRTSLDSAHSRRTTSGAQALGSQPMALPEER